MTAQSKYPFKQYDHIQITDDELDGIFAVDPVLLAYEDDKARIRDVIESQKRVEADARVELSKLELEEAEVLAKLRELDRRKRETRGVVSSAIAHQTRCESKIKERDKRGEVRRRSLYKAELNKRLKALGRDLSKNITFRTHDNKESPQRSVLRPPSQLGAEAVPENQEQGGSSQVGEGSQA